jgi:hypothetical protein
MIDRQKIKNNAIVKKFYNATFALANQFYAIRYFFSSTKFDYNKKLFCQKYQISYQCLAGLSLHESAQVHQDAIKAGVIKGSIAALCCKFIAFKEAEQKMSALFEQDEAGKFILNAELFEKFHNEYPKQAEKLLNLSGEY